MKYVKNLPSPHLCGNVFPVLKPGDREWWVWAGEFKLLLSFHVAVPLKMLEVITAVNHSHTYIQGNRGLPNSQENKIKHWQTCWSINPCISEHHTTRHVNPVTTVNKRKKIKIIKNYIRIRVSIHRHLLEQILKVFHSLVPSFTGKAGNTHSLGYLSLFHILLIMHHLHHLLLPLRPRHLLLLQNKITFWHLYLWVQVIWKRFQILEIKMFLIKVQAISAYCSLIY